jgi:SAM-dependent methyltransferase
MHWTEEFFDDYYLQSIDQLIDSEKTVQEVDFIIKNTEITHDSMILDLACGEGRHANEFARRGYRHVKGIDLTPTYIETARKNSELLKFSPQFIQANMKEFDEQDKYNLIYSLFTSMFYFSDTHNLDVLSRLFSGLQNEGFLVVDYFNPIAFLKSKNSKDWYLTSEDLVILEKFSHNPISGIITNERMIITPDGNRIKRVYHIRDYTVAELRFHFEEIGFEILDVFGSFDGEKYTIDSPRQIYLLKKPNK